MSSDDGQLPGKEPVQTSEEEVDYKRILRSDSFRELIRTKRNFIVPSVVFILIFFWTWALLTGFTAWLNGSAVGVINWAIVYTYAQLVVAIVFCHLYATRARTFDELGEQAKSEARQRSEESV